MVKFEYHYVILLNKSNIDNLQNGYTMEQVFKKKKKTRKSMGYDNQ